MAELIGRITIYLSCVALRGGNIVTFRDPHRLSLNSYDERDVGCPQKLSSLKIGGYNACR